MKYIRKVSTMVLPLFVSLSLFLSSCSSSSSGSGSSSPQSLKVIPDGSTNVTIIDLNSIGQKGFLKELSDLQIINDLKREVRNENNKIYSMLDDFIEDPYTSGLNFQKDVFVFGINESYDERFFAISAEMYDRSVLEEFLVDIMKEARLNDDIEEEDGFSYINIEDESIIGWDDDKILLLIPTERSSKRNLEDKLGELMDLPEKNQISSSEKFNEFYNKKRDISMWFTSNVLNEEREFQQLQNQLNMSLSDNYLSTYIELDDNSISLLTEYSLNKDLQKLMDKYDLFDNSSNSSLPKYFPNESFAAASISLNSDAFRVMLKDMDGFEQFQGAFEYETGLEVDDLFEMIQGNAMISLIGFENMKYTDYEYGYNFYEDSASLYEEQLPISTAGYISYEDKLSLNEGKTVQTTAYPDYSINIQNILDAGGSIESAIEYDDNVIWYYGGWEWGAIPVESQVLLPLVSMTIDIDGDETMYEIIQTISDSSMVNHGYYYEFEADGGYTVYLAYNDDICIITNDIRSINEFREGGFRRSLASSDQGPEFLNNIFYAYMNLDFDELPSEYKDEILENQSFQEQQMFELWNSIAESIEFKMINQNSFEIILKTKDFDSSSLSNILLNNLM